MSMQATQLDTHSFVGLCLVLCVVLDGQDDWLVAHQACKLHLALQPGCSGICDCSVNKERAICLYAVCASYKLCCSEVQPATIFQQCGTSLRAVVKPDSFSGGVSMEFLHCSTCLPAADAKPDSASFSLGSEAFLDASVKAPWQS